MTGKEGRRLPDGFEALEPFVEHWARATTADRVTARLDSDEARRSAFYTAAKDRLGDALALLDRKPLGEHDEQERCLLDLMLSLSHVALAVEVQGDQEDLQAEDRRFMRVIGSTADRIRVA